MLFDLVEGTATIFGTWVVLIAAFVGLGLAVRRLSDLSITTDALIGSFWLGAALSILFLQIWHVVSPITGATLAIVSGSGFAGLAWNSRALGAWVTDAWSRSRLTWLCQALTGLWVANRATNSVAAYDSGMYHIPAVTWAKTYAIVPGLANLHGRFGFNNSSLLLAAMVDVGPWAGRSTHLVNGLFLAVLLATISHRLTTMIRVGRAVRTAVFDVVLLTPSIFLALDPEYVSSLTTDLPAAIVLFVACSRTLRQISGPSSEGDAREDAFDLAVTTGLCSLAVCFKLSAVVFAFLLWLIAAGWWLHAHRKQHVWFAGGLCWPVVLSAGLLSVWIVRGVILSGFPFYPSTVAAAPVEWRVPTEQAEAEAAWVGHFARNFYSPNAFDRVPYGDRVTWEWKWFRPWLQGSLPLPRVRWLLVLPLTLALGFVTVGVALHRPASPVGPVWLLFIPTLAAMLFWFLIAPRPPFGFHLFWMLAALCATCALGPRLETASTQMVRFAAVVAALIGCAPVLEPVAVRIITSRTTSGSGLLSSIVVLPGSDRGLRPPAGTAIDHLQPYTTRSGLQLVVPDTGNQCWFAEPLCTPHPAPNLRLRREGVPASGFVVEGTWQALRFPNPGTNWLESWRAYRAARH